MAFSIKFDREEDGRWIAEIPELPGVMAYGDSPMAAFDGVIKLGAEVSAEQEVG